MGESNMKTTISERLLGSLIANSIKKRINEDHKVRNWERDLMKDYPYMFRDGQNLYYVRLDNNNQVKAAWKTDLDGGNRELVKAPEVQMLIDQKNIKLTKRNIGDTNTANTQSNTNTPNTNTTQGTGESAGRLMTLDDFCYKAGINQKVNTDELKKYLKSPDIKTDANHWKQFFNNPKIQELFTNNPGVMDAVNSYDDEFDAKPDIQKVFSKDEFGKLSASDFNNGNYQPGAGEGMDKSGKPMTFNEIMNVIHQAGQRGDAAITFTDMTTGSAGYLRGQNPEHVKKTILKQLDYAGRTLSKTDPQNYQKASNIINNWISGKNQSIRIKDVAWAMSVIGKILNTSRNEIPVVMGLQKALNYFGIKDSKGRQFKVDGVIGPETSAALKNAGFKDIYEWKDTIYNYQQKQNVPPKPDGIVGNNTIKAFQNSNLTSIDMLNRYKTGAVDNNLTNVNQNTSAKVSNVLNTANNQPITLTQSQGNGPRPGMMAESKRHKVKITENTLNKLILESIKKNLLNEINRTDFLGVNINNMGVPENNKTFNPEAPTYASNNKPIPKGVYQSLYNGKYQYRVEDAWGILFSMGFSDKQIVEAVKNGTFYGTTDLAKQNLNNVLQVKEKQVNSAAKSSENQQAWKDATKNSIVGSKSSTQETPLAAGNTREKMAQDAEQAQINRQAPTNLNQWDKLPLYGTPNSRLAFIQTALGIQADGKLGPQTLGTIFKKIGKPVTIGNVTMDPKYLQNATWQPGKNGVISK